MRNGRSTQRCEVLLGFQVVIEDFGGDVNELHGVSQLSVAQRYLALLNLEELVGGHVFLVAILEDLALFELLLDFRELLLRV